MTHETIADLLLARLGDDRPGLRTRERTWTWDEVVRESSVRADLAGSLRTDGPFHIGVLLDNVAEFVFWLGAAGLAGASIVGINPTRRGSYLEQEVRHADCQFVVTDRSGMETLQGLDIGVDDSRILCTDGDSYARQVAARSVDPSRDPAISRKTRMLLLFTSGTTGASKAAICSQGRLTDLGYRNSAKFDVGADDVCYCPMPLFHGNALMALWAPALAAGACVALTPKFSASSFLADVRHFGATYFTYVGKAIGYVLAQPERSDDSENTLTHGFGTEASPEDQARFLRRFGCRLVEGYGSSESAGMLELAPDAAPGVLGVAARDSVRVVDQETLAGCEPAVLDEHGRVLNPEEAVGEIVDTAGASRFEGYYQDAAANAERVRYGWYWTGDLGYVDRNGYFYFAGRAGDWVRVDGENLSALVTERVLLRHPDVLAAAVFGVADPRAGDQVMAAVEITGEVTFEELELPVFLAAQQDLGLKGMPRFVRVSRALPTTGSGKLRKKQMQAQSWSTDDPVYRWVGRGDPEYARMTEENKAALRAEFHTHGRQRFLS